MAKYIKVSAIGVRLLKLDKAGGYGSMADKIVGQLKWELDQVLPDKPDLVVLPEICDRPYNLSGTELNGYYSACGGRLLEFLAGAANKNRCNIAYTTLREDSGGKWRNSTILINRDGNITGIYDKNYPDSGEIEFCRIQAGKEAPVFQCDFGRVACVISTDLHFKDLRERYAAGKPEVVVFPSTFYGGFLQHYLAYSCRAYLVSAVCRASNYKLQSEIVSPAGKILAYSVNYYNFVTANINLDYIVAHADFNEEAFEDIKRKYGPAVGIDTPGGLGAFSITSETEKRDIRGMASEFKMEEVDHYFGRCRAERNKFVLGPRNR